jgi:hypothetical protein
MVIFDKEIVEDPLDKLGFVKAPNDTREGPVVNTVTDQLMKEKGESYHQSNPRAAHWSSLGGCSHKTYLNYMHKLDPELEPYPNEPNAEWTFTHGDLIHEKIQQLFVDALGEDHVTVEESVNITLETQDAIAARLGREIPSDYETWGHADLVIRDHENFPSPFVIDIKTTAEFKYYNFGKKGHARTIPKESHIKQLHGYMNAIGARMACLLYYSKRNDHLEEYWFTFQDEIFQESKEWLTSILDAVFHGEPPERDAKSFLCDERYCNYYREGICPGVDEVSPNDNYDPEKIEQFMYETGQWV